MPPGVLETGIGAGYDSAVGLLGRTLTGGLPLALFAAGALSTPALASKPTLPKHPSKKVVHALVKAAGRVRSLRGGRVIFEATSPTDRHWAVVDMLRGVSPAPNGAHASQVPSITRQAMHQRHGRWNPAKAPLGPITRTLFRRPTFRITYDGHGTEHNHQVITQDFCVGGNVDLRGDATFAWHGVYSKLTEDQLYFQGRDTYSRGSTVSGQETIDDHVPSCDPQSPPYHAVCNFTFHALDGRVSPLGWLLESEPRSDASVDIHVPVPDTALKPPAGGCRDEPNAVRWSDSAGTSFHTDPETFFFTVKKEYPVAIDNPDLARHERTLETATGSDTVDWTGKITVTRDGSYTVPLRSSP